MKKYYKVVSLALAGAITTSSLASMPVEAEEAVSNQDLQAKISQDADAIERVQEDVSDTEESQTQEVLDSSQEFETPIDVEAIADADTPVVFSPDAEELTGEPDSDEESLIDDSEETDSIEAATEEEALEENALEEKAPEEKTEEELLAELEKLEADKELELEDPKDGEDFNEDGISDLMTKALCDGDILTASGSKVFGDYSYARVQMSNDIDGDGLLNGEEVVTKLGEDGKEYAVMLSDPCKADTDDDGISDIDDTDKWNYGLAGGVVGSVRLVSRFDKTQGPTHGHVYIVYTSYVDGLDISIDDLYGYYVTTDEYRNKLNTACANPEDASIVSWRSTVDEITEANEADRKAAAEAMYAQQDHEQHTSGKVTLNRGDYVSIGNYGMATTEEVINTDYLPKAKELFKDNIEDLTKIYNAVMGDTVSQEYVNANYQQILLSLGANSTEFVDYVLNGKTPGGIWINRELYNQKYAYDQGPNEVIEKDITKDQLEKDMLKTFSDNSYFNMLSHNCSTVGTDAWNETFGYQKDENGETLKDEKGNRIKSDYYVESSVRGTIKGVGKDINIRFGCPAIVSHSIQAMKNLSGYIGHMTYVTGKKITNTIVAVAKKFDITKLFVRKSVAADENNNSNSNVPEKTVTEVSSEDKTQTQPTTSSKSEVKATLAIDSQNSIAYNNENSTDAKDESSTMIDPADVEIAANSATTVDNTSATKKAVASAKAASKTGKSVATSERTEDEKVEEVEEVEEAEEEIKQDSSLEKTEIKDEAVPLDAAKKTNSFLWIWGIVALALAAAGTTVFTIYKKRNK